MLLSSMTGSAALPNAMAPPEVIPAGPNLALYTPLKCFVLHATSPLGCAVVRRFAVEGPMFMLTDLPHAKDALEGLARAAAKQGASRCHMHVGDIYQWAGEQEITRTALSTMGEVDVLVVVPPEEGRQGATARTAPRHTAVVRGLVEAFLPRMEKDRRGWVLAVLRPGRDDRLANELQALRTDIERRGGGVQVVMVPYSEDVEGVAEALLQPLKLVAGTEDLPVGQGRQDEEGEEGELAAKEVMGASVWRGAVGGVLPDGSRLSTGLLRRRLAEGELATAASDSPGAVVTAANPLLLEPEYGHIYDHEPRRDPALRILCLEPFNGETPARVLCSSFLTPARTFFVRNHLPVPIEPPVDTDKYRLLVDGVGMATTELSQELRTSFRQVTVTATIQCAGNRRAEVAAVKLVEGRAPWNAGGIGTAEWTGVLLRDVLDRASNLPLLSELGAGPDVEQLVGQHVCFQGLDRHAKSHRPYEASIPITKALDARGDVLLAHSMNGEPLAPDHGHPLRVIIPGFVGARMVKWLARITVSENESQAPWMQEDYRLLPVAVKDHVHARPLWKTAPPIMTMPVQAAILVPEAGTVIPRGLPVVEVRGYAWSGGGHSITRVDVTADGGQSWVVAEWLHKPRQAEGRVWAWTLWQARVPLSEEAQHTGRLELACKALDRSGNSQPERVDSIWNFRGLLNNAWHRRVIHVR